MFHNPVFNNNLQSKLTKQRRKQTKSQRNIILLMNYSTNAVRFQEQTQQSTGLSNHLSRVLERVKQAHLAKIGNTMTIRKLQLIGLAHFRYRMTFTALRGQIQKLQRKFKGKLRKNQHKKKNKNKLIFKCLCKIRYFNCSINRRIRSEKLFNTYLFN